MDLLDLLTERGYTIGPWCVPGVTYPSLHEAQSFMGLSFRGLLGLLSFMVLLCDMLLYCWKTGPKSSEPPTHLCTPAHAPVHTCTRRLTQQAEPFSQVAKVCVTRPLTGPQGVCLLSLIN